MRTMTASTTSDSIWGLAGMLFALHLATAEYRLPGTEIVPTRPRRSKQPVEEGIKYVVAGQTNGVPAYVSLNAAMCASVVLASRLHNEPSVFALLFMSLNLFALVPAFRSRMVRYLVARAKARHARHPASASSSLATTEQVRRDRHWAQHMPSATLFVLTLVVSSALEGWIKVVLAFHWVSVLLVTFVGPLWLYRAQASRCSLAGPWDPAVPIVRAGWRES